jgi:hypothetical protein
LEIDHVIPEALGGPTEAANLRALCADCNSGKSATPPDAARVEQVSRDALRWAQAQQVAAQQMLTDYAAVTAHRAEFDAAWSEWTCGKNKEPVPRDSDWPDSVDRLLAAGLPMPILIECIGQAMRNKTVPADRAFRYMCGVAWRRVRDLTEVTAAVAEDDGDDDSEENDASSLSERILSWFQPGEVEAYRDRSMEDVEDPDDRAELDAHAAYLAFTDHLAAARSWHFHTKALFEALPQAVSKRVLDRAEADVAGQAGVEPYSTFDVLAWAVHCLAYEIKDIPENDGEGPVMLP